MAVDRWETPFTVSYRWGELESGQYRVHVRLFRNYRDEIELADDTTAVITIEESLDRYPNLVITNGWIDPEIRYFPVREISFDYEISNICRFNPARPSRSYFYISDDEELSGDDQLVRGSRNPLDSIPPNESLRVNGEILTIRDWLFPGEHYVIIEADAEQEFVDVQTSTTAEVELEIRNVGLDTLEIIDMYITPERGRFGFDFEWEDLLPGFSATGYVLFFPDREGEYEAVLHIESNDRDEGLLEIPISGTALEIEESSIIPNDFSITSVHPNPFNSSVRIGFDLPAAELVSLKIYDTSGSMVAELLNWNLPKGSHRVTWAADDFPAGIYIAQLSTPSAAKTAKLVLVR